MSFLRPAARLLKACQSLESRVSIRAFSSVRGHGKKFAMAGPLVAGSLSIGIGYGLYKTYKAEEGMGEHFGFKVMAAAATPESQPSVFSQTKNHALYLTIHLKPSADVKACAKVVANLQKHVDTICPPKERDEDDEVWAGAGFGTNFYSQVAGKTKQNFTYAHRKGALGEMPSTGGDIFIHAKSNTVSKLFELAQRIMQELPAGSVDKLEDIYSFVYQNGRDLSGFIDGTENPADEDDRKRVAVETTTGGSYVITQKWIHKMDLIQKEKDRTTEGWVGRSKPDSTELARKTATSHVARMTGGTNFQQKKVFEIVRQSMPYGNLHDKAGLFFIGYSASPQNLDFMLDRMVGAGGDGLSDDIMRLTECVSGTYWYFPGAEELKRLA